MSKNRNRSLMNSVTIIDFRGYFVDIFVVSVEFSLVFEIKFTRHQRITYVPDAFSMAKEGLNSMTRRSSASVKRTLL